MRGVRRYLHAKHRNGWKMVNGNKNTTNITKPKHAVLLTQFFLNLDCGFVPLLLIDTVNYKKKPKIIIIVGGDIYQLIHKDFNLTPENCQNL